MYQRVIGLQLDQIFRKVRVLYKNAAASRAVQAHVPYRAKNRKRNRGTESDSDTVRHSSQRGRASLSLRRTASGACSPLWWL
jgi:hypothetical protein